MAGKGLAEAAKAQSLCGFASRCLIYSRSG